MTYDTQVPASLKEIQQWFAGAITQRIDEDSYIDPIARSGRLMQEEAKDFIVPSPTLEPAQRIEIYAQQYWWRLLGAMHENLPLVTRLFGYHDFNQTLAFPYLIKYPSTHWSLSFLTTDFVHWLEEDYHANDKSLVVDAARIDCAYIHSFLAEQKPYIDDALLPESGDLSSVTACHLTLQPHVQLFAFSYNIFEYRIEFLLQEPEYWVEHDFPKLEKFDKPLHYVLYRNSGLNLEVAIITHSEAQLLQKFVEGCTIDGLCDWLEQQPEDSVLCQEAGEQLSSWIQKWIALRWLALTI
ncbi:MAG: putative DNA-binding domain-containing protein [Parachlamydiaceae bacterium]|nr:putative DNA-binding domain-containing protein [Parachlamydiaceae bacterium]